VSCRYRRTGLGHIRTHALQNRLAMLPLIESVFTGKSFSAAEHWDTIIVFLEYR